MLELNNPTVEVLRLEELPGFIERKEKVLAPSEVDRIVDEIITLTQPYV